MIPQAQFQLLIRITVFVEEFSSRKFDVLESSDRLEMSLESFAEIWRNQTLCVVNSSHKEKEKKIIISPLSNKLLLISSFFYSPKNQKEVFEPIVIDLQEEYFEALFKKKIWKARWINLRYTYAFLTAMWQKSLIGDFIEFISKIAK